MGLTIMYNVIKTEELKAIEEVTAMNTHAEIVYTAIETEPIQQPEEGITELS